MNTSKTSWGKALTNSLQGFFIDPLTLYAFVVVLFVALFIVLDTAYPQIIEWTSSRGFYWLENHYPIFATSDDREFSKGFVEWFGVFYGFLLPMLLIRAWEQLDSADREFDREADAIKVLLEDILLLDDKNFLDFKKTMIAELDGYVQHILSNYKIEHRTRDIELKIRGDAMLQGIRTNYKELIYRGGGEKASQLEPVTTELLDRLNDVIDTRGDRISIFGQRLFESLKIVAIVTSLIWLIPFYFLAFQHGLFGSILKLAVTFLIIFVLTIINDLDEPFFGTWKIHIASWMDVQKEIQSSLASLQQVPVLQPVEQEAPTAPVTEEKKISHASATATTHAQVILDVLAGLLAFKYLFFGSQKPDQEK